MRSIEGADLTKEVARVLGNGESGEFAARLIAVKVGALPSWDFTSVILTGQRLILCRDRFIGRVRADFEVPWTNVHRVDGVNEAGLHGYIRLTVETTRGALTSSARNTPSISNRRSGLATSGPANWDDTKTTATSVAPGSTAVRVHSAELGRRQPVATASP